MEMLKPIEKYRKIKEIKSNDALAKELLERYKDLDWGTKERSLGAKLGLIDNGNCGWWLKRPSLSAALAEHLDVSAADLGIHPQETSDIHLFSEFPELPPLRLASEIPCDIGEPFCINDKGELDDMNRWLGKGMTEALLRQPPAGVYWLHFPPGRGVDLFWEYLKRSSKYTCKHSNTIRDAAKDLKSPRHLILRIDSAEKEHDISALATMHPETALLVISPHAAPLRSDDGYIHPFCTWERITSSSQERRKYDLLTASFNSLTAFEWRLHKDWIKRLLVWIERRLQQPTDVDTLFTAEELLEWLTEFPYLNSQLHGPGDLLHLSSLFHKSQRSKRPKANSLEAGNEILKQILPHSTSIRENFHKLTLAAWNSEELSWGNAQSIRRWNTLADASWDDNLIKIDTIVKSSDLPTRKKIARQIKKPEPRINTLLLQDNKFLEVDAGEELTLRPRFLPWLLARDHVIACMTNDGLDSWAFNCFDEKRRLVVDAALDTLKLDQLLPIAAQIPDSLDGNAAAIAAAEALFYSIGRRIDHQTYIPQELLAIATLVLNNLTVDHKISVPRPWSRYIADEIPKLDWISVCWAWSLVPCPDGIPLYLKASWLFPCWASDLDNSNHFDFVNHIIEDKCDIKDKKLKSIFQLAPKIVSKIDKPIAVPPTLLKPFFIAEAAKGKWEIDPDWWVEIFDKKWSDEILIDQITKKNSTLIPTLLLANMLDQTPQWRSENEFSCFMLIMSKLWVTLIERLPAEALVNDLSPQQFELLTAYPESLPPHLVTKALELLLSKPERLRQIANKLILVSQVDSLSILFQLLDTNYWRTVGLQIWQLAPHEAQSIIKLPFDLSLNAKRNLIITCPNFEVSAKLMSEFSIMFMDHEVRKWVCDNLPHAGARSQEILDLLERPQ